jgi:hypothetical protein
MKYLLVFLGLEGSGHHGICSVFSGHVKHNVALENSIKKFIHADESTWSNLSLNVGKILQKTLDNSTFMFQCSNKLESPEGFKMSYPDENLFKENKGNLMEGKITSFLDAPSLQKICSENKVEMIPIYIHRNLSDAIISSTRFGDFASQTRILRLTHMALENMKHHLKNVITLRYKYFAHDLSLLQKYLDIRILNTTKFYTHTHIATEIQTNFLKHLRIPM